jgi:hypothetical protein
MRPVAQSDRHDGPRLVDELVPGIAAVLEDVLVGAEDAIGEPVVADELPDVFDRIEFGRLWRQRHQGNVGRNVEHVGEVPSGLIEQHNGMGSRRHRLGDLGQMQRHRCGVAARQDEAGLLAPDRWRRRCRSSVSADHAAPRVASRAAPSAG